MRTEDEKLNEGDERLDCIKSVTFGSEEPKRQSVKINRKCNIKGRNEEEKTCLI